MNDENIEAAPNVGPAAARSSRKRIALMAGVVGAAGLLAGGLVAGAISSASAGGGPGVQGGYGGPQGYGGTAPAGRNDLHGGPGGVPGGEQGTCPAPSSGSDGSVAGDSTYRQS